MYQIIASLHGPVKLEAYDTNNHKGALLSGSRAFQSNNENGTILVQEYSSNKFTIHYNEFFSAVKNKLTVLTESRSIQTNSALKTKNNQNYLEQRITVKEGQFSLIPGPVEKTELILEGGKEYQQFSIGYHTSFVEGLIPYFPFLEPFIKETKTDVGWALSSPRWMPREALYIIDQMLHCNYEPALRDFFFEDKAGDLLFYMLVELSKKKPSLKDLSPADIEKVYVSRTIILNDLTQHFNITQLARKVGINEFKLKIGFKQLFGVGPFAFLKNERMHKAYDLLLNTDKPIKDVQSITGYASLTSFVGAFRKFFGKTPGDIRYR